MLRRAAARPPHALGLLQLLLLLARSTSGWNVPPRVRPTPGAAANSDPVSFVPRRRPPPAAVLSAGAALSLPSSNAARQSNVFLGRGGGGNSSTTLVRDEASRGQEDQRSGNPANSGGDGGSRFLKSFFGEEFLLQFDPAATTASGNNSSVSLATTGQEATGTDGGLPALKVQLAVSEEEQHRGLMFRTSMPEDEGMLFLYRAPAQRVLYMRNTPLPLDAAWFGRDGQLREVQRLVPHDETWRWTEHHDLLFGIEANEGYFSRHGLEPGKARLQLPSLRAAILGKGHAPEEFSLR